jgi:hypothetical protein
MNTVHNCFIPKSLWTAFNCNSYSDPNGNEWHEDLRLSGGIKAVVYWDVTPCVFILIQTFRRLSAAVKKATGSPRSWYVFTKLHGVKSQKIVIFIS